MQKVPINVVVPCTGTEQMSRSFHTGRGGGSIRKMSGIGKQPGKKRGGHGGVHPNAIGLVKAMDDFGGRARFRENDIQMPIALIGGVVVDIHEQMIGVEM